MDRNTLIALRTAADSNAHQAAQLARAVNDALEAAARESAKVATVRIGSLEWSHTLNDGERLDYEDAAQVCAALGDGWRLPTRVELESLLDLSRHDPAIDATTFGDTKSGSYWSSTPCTWAPSCAWVVGFGYGLVGSLPRDDYALVRAVRSVPAGQ